MKSYRWTLAQCGWYPYEKRRSGHRHIPRDNHVTAWGGDGHLHAKERGPWRHWACGHFDLGLPASRLWDDKCVLFKPPTAWSYIMKAQADLDHGGSSFRGRCSGGCPQTPVLPVLKSHSPAAECHWWWWTQSCLQSPGSLPSAQGSCLIQRHGTVLMTHPHPTKAWTPRPIRDNSPGSSIPVLKLPVSLLESQPTSSTPVLPWPSLCGPKRVHNLKTENYVLHGKQTWAFKPGTQHLRELWGTALKR